MPCSCCKGALTFQEAHDVRQKLAGLCATPNQKDSNFRAVLAAACWGLENCKEFLSLSSDKESITGKCCSRKPPCLSRVCSWSSSNRVPRQRKHSGRKEKAENESIHATRKLEQTQVKLDSAQKALEAMAKDRRESAVQGAFDTVIIRC